MRKWTKKVDIFDMDYVLVPIHDHAHWSLAVICQPGAWPPRARARRGGTPCAARRCGANARVRAGNLRFQTMQAAEMAYFKFSKERPDDEEGMAELRQAPPPPVVLHLDSIRDGGHDSSAVGEALRSWLRCGAAETLCGDGAVGRAA